jgi:hypothetical protein
MAKKPKTYTLKFSQAQFDLLRSCEAFRFQHTSKARDALLELAKREPRNISLTQAIIDCDAQIATHYELSDMLFRAEPAR